ncbi:MAG: DNA-binding protein [Alphaproteobacteria bacterium HGW-Alphaproteobacteria-16]|nr:MAG: DNA-binding protein [Alphaproteobacteria bacterium HGW-Alphaproteobacteria-16]
MIFVDTNVLLDVLESASTPEAEWSRRELARVAGEETLAANLIVAAELAGQVRDADALEKTLTDAEIALVDIDVPVAFRAGRAFREYRRRGGARSTILPDFLIAAHAEQLGATLLTRDRGLRSYFPDLTFITPETHPHG